MYLRNVKYIGPKTIEILNANQIYTPRDLLLCFPKKYHIYQVDDKNIFSGEAVCFKCQIASRPVLIKSRGNSRAFVFYILIGNQKYKCIIFSGDFLKYKLQVGLPLICYGKYKLKDKEFSISTIFFDDFVCKIELDYGFKEVKNKLISNAVLACIKEGVLVEETLPEEYILKYRLLDKNTLIQMAHFPSSIEDCIKTKRRIRYEDFFWYAASLEILKLSRGFEHKEPKIFEDLKIKNIVDSLPYQLTTDQNKAIEVILDDLRSIKPMNRLVEGDVGCGKSIVAFMASIAVIEAGYQIALMAPTEILAWQHYNNFKKQFSNYQVEILTSSTKEKEREDILYRLVHQRVDMIIGTHTLIQDYVIFSRLGLVIIDEQHRFGVNQRKTLLEKWQGVDALYLTATPIPRTLGLTTFGDLDLTLIKEMPLNRKKIITKIVSKDGLNALGRVLQRHLIMEEQIYIVVPFIEENETLDYMDIESALEIFKELLPEARMDILHGKMRPKEKDAIMNQFKTHQLDCLISTTVIEVGVDVANATVMVILDAERYGLSQLHQLRGRVGRGKLQSYCYLVSRKEETERLKILEQTTDGFIIAEEDFKLRGPGDYLGEEQSGFDNLHIDFSSKDAIIWKCAMEDSKEYVAKCFNGEVIDEKINQLIEQSQLKKAKIN